MEDLHRLIDMVIAIMNIKMDVGGYDITLMSLAIWTTLAFFLLWFTFSLFK